MAKAKPFATEADLCAAFIAAIRNDGWTAYAETAGWDILLVRATDGFQIGIQAKLRLNTEVINQTLEEHGYGRVMHAGPDCRAVLVPDGDAGAFSRIADYIGLTIIRMRSCTPSEYGWRAAGGGHYASAFSPDLPKEGSSYQWEHWHELCPAKRHKLPEYVPDVAAGASAPLQLTEWKIAAIKIVVTIELRGYVTRADFKAHNIDHRRWVPQGWLTSKGGEMRPGEALPDFRRQHPVVYEQIKADAPKWMTAAPQQLLLGEAP